MTAAKIGELEVLPDCRLPGSYRYAGSTRERDGLTLATVDELYAKLPISATKLEANRGRSRRLQVDMALVGMFEAERGDYSRGDYLRADLIGRCARAARPDLRRGQPDPEALIAETPRRVGCSTTARGPATCSRCGRGSRATGRPRASIRTARRRRGRARGRSPRTVTRLCRPRRLGYNSRR